MRMNLKIYGQKCFTCLEWGSGSIIHYDMESLTRIYSILVEILMYNRDNLHVGLELHNYEKNGSAPKSKKDVKMVGRVLKHR